MRECIKEAKSVDEASSGTQSNSRLSICRSAGFSGFAIPLPGYGFILKSR